MHDLEDANKKIKILKRRFDTVLEFLQIYNDRVLELESMDDVRDLQSIVMDLKVDISKIEESWD